jgi:mannan endo-1,4-beta-mannosidase
MGSTRSFEQAEGLIDRRHVLLGATAALAACATGSGRSDPAMPFVRRDGMRLMLGERAYRFAGANMWYGAYLGAAAPLGDPDRLRRELDRLAAIGVTNLRILASSELSPLRDSLRPAFSDQGPVFNEALLHGLDTLLDEMAKRRMRAVLYLTNFWEWSGGMMTYLSWTNGGRYIDNGDPAHPWPEFLNFNADFYRSEEAVGLYHDYVRAVVSRTNGVTGRRYADDPAIMAWRLANEPRPGGDEPTVRAAMPAFFA